MATNTTTDTLKIKIKNILEKAKASNIDYYTTSMFLKHGIIANYNKYTPEEKEKLEKQLNEIIMEENVSKKEVKAFINLNNRFMAKTIKELEEKKEQEEYENPKSSEQQEKSMDSETEKNKLDKSSKLIEKVEMLSKRIEQEKNPIKRHILSFKVRMLLSKIQREIDLQNIRENYKIRKDELKIQKENKEKDSIDNIAMIGAKVQLLKKELRANEEYDTESSRFMYPKNYVDRSGGIEEVKNKLKQSKRPETKEVSKKIEEMQKKREELDKLEKELQKEQEILDNSAKEYEKQERELNFKEKSLVLKQNINIFSRIKSFFGNIADQTRMFFDEMKQEREYDLELKQKEKELEDEYNKRMDELRQQSDQEKEGLRSLRGSETAYNYRTQVSEMAKQVNQETNTKNNSSESKVEHVTGTVEPTQKSEGR